MRFCRQDGQYPGQGVPYLDALLRNTPEDVIAFQKDLWNMGVASACGDAGILHETG